jgi:Protein of unknown function (DUF1242)
MVSCCLCSVHCPLATDTHHQRPHTLLLALVHTAHAIATCPQSAIFDFSSLITVLLLLICTCTYVKLYKASIFDHTAEPHRHTGFKGVCWKLSRIGERVSPYVSVCCLMMAVHELFIDA